MLDIKTINQPIKERLSIINSRKNKENLVINEIYCSIQGESSYMGLPCVFIRTSGCHLRCSYCDTKHAFSNGEEISILTILKKVTTFNIKLVEVTGGEPLLQSQTFLLLQKLVENRFTVLLETSGAVSIAKVNRAVKVILDIKTPSSLECNKNLYRNLDILWPGCEVKFVVGDFDDYLFAKEILKKHRLFEKTHVLFSPVFKKLDPKTLVEWILKDQLPIRFQLQLHKVLYGEEIGR